MVFCARALVACGLLAGLASSVSAATPDHVVIVLLENKAFGQIIGNFQAPYINSLANQGALFTNYYALTHPSQANYLHFYSGASQGVTSGATPAAGAPFTTPNLGAELLAGGYTLVCYSLSLPSVGYTFGAFNGYRRAHNPVVNWQNSPQGPNQYGPQLNVPFSLFPMDFSLLPTVSIVVPDVFNDMHDGSIAQSDAWLSANLNAYATWAGDHNSLLIITFDEDMSNDRNRVATIFYGAGVRQGLVSTTWTHHNLARTIEDWYGTAHAGAMNQVKPIVGAMVDDPQLHTLSFRQNDHGYSGVTDTFLDAVSAAGDHANDQFISVDSSPANQALIRFDGLIGDAMNQIPEGADIRSAKLMFLTGSGPSDFSTNSVSIYRMLMPWQGGDTWSSLAGGIFTDGVEAETVPDFTLLPDSNSTYAIFDVTDTVQAWVNGAVVNNGWVIMGSGSDNWRAVSSNSSSLGDRPRLEVTYAPPLLCISITTQPLSVVGCRGADASFTVTATGTSHCGYQWRHNGQMLPGETDPTLVLHGTGEADEGVYDCIVTNDCGQVFTRLASLVICIGDYNCDGGVDGSDVDAFFMAWENGDAASDVNEDGGVDGGDVGTFFDAWSLGC